MKLHLNAFLAVSALLVGGCLCPACTSTVTPVPVTASEASYDGTVADSGVISAVRDAQGSVTGWIVSERARARYNALIVRYGETMWTPVIGADYGLRACEDGTWIMSPEAMVKFVAMSAVARMRQ